MIKTRHFSAKNILSFKLTFWFFVNYELQKKKGSWVKSDENNPSKISVNFNTHFTEKVGWNKENKFLSNRTLYRDKFQGATVCQNLIIYQFHQT